MELICGYLRVDHGGSTVAAGAMALADLALFDECSARDLEDLSAAVTGVRHIAEGTVLCREGEVADRWWIVVDGLAEVTVGGLYVATIGPGESIGELALLDVQPRNATVTASSEMVVHEVDGARFLALLADHPAVTLALLRQLAARLRATTEHTARPVSSTHYSPIHAAPLSRPVSDEPVTFNPFAPGYFFNPYEQYAQLRQHQPVYLDRLTGAYILTRYADVHRLARDRSISVGTTKAAPTPVIEAEVARDTAGGGASLRMMLRRDGEDHSRLRELVARAFTPKAISSWQQLTETAVDSLLTELADRNAIDVIADFASLFPATIIAEMLGMPPPDIHQLRHWSQALTKTFDPLNSPHEEAAFIEASRDMSEYIETVLKDKRAQPGNDVLTSLISAEHGSERLDHDELVAQIMLLYVAGYENALNLVGNGIVHLFEFPEQLDRMRTEPPLDANAIEEIIRFDSPVQFTRRICVEPLHVEDIEIPAGSVLFLGLGAANHDPRKWGDSADVLDLARARANEHASFGGGPHHCLGSSLARLEARVALPRLVRRFPHMVPAYDVPQWAARMIVRGVEQLPVLLQGA